MQFASYRKAGCDLVNDLPNGLETILGEKGVGCQAVNDSELLLQSFLPPAKYNCNGRSNKRIG